MSDTFVTTSELASILEVSRQTIAARVKAGSITPLTQLPKSGIYLFSNQEVDRLLMEKFNAEEDAA